MLQILGKDSGFAYWLGCCLSADDVHRFQAEESRLYVPFLRDAELVHL